MVELGIEGERFVASNLGAELTKRMQMDHDNAMCELLSVNPCNAESVREIQNRARLPIMLMQYLNDIIEEGHQAENIISGEE